MPEGRPAIPAELKRRVLMEAGHRCAIPTCKSVPVEIAHIEPYSEVRGHSFENLIALCPTCHARYDQGAIDRLSMKGYKSDLSPEPVHYARLAAVIMADPEFAAALADRVAEMLSKKTQQVLVWDLPTQMLLIHANMP